jgi:16S rRNA (adenine1518-N6/adenine1519-N6)-dimethyltransferase
MSKNHPRALLTSLQIRPRRSLGQNFLIHEEIAAQLVRGCDFSAQMGILEIGPGLGIMTQAVLNEAKQMSFPWFKAVETDSELFLYLQSHFAENPRVEFIHGDFLEEGGAGAFPGENETFQVLGNLPYSRASEMILRLVEISQQVSKMGLMVQKEVAKRLTAVAGTKAYGRLSILPQNFFEISSLMTLSGTSFYPQAKVDSVFLLFKRRGKPLVDLSDPSFRRLFEDLVRCIYQGRRKTLANNLKRLFSNKKLPWSEILKNCQIDPKRRGETLIHDELACITRAIAQSMNNGLQKF